ncbi:6247_t:CDS:2, partial [Acaulospora colombiana]
MSSEAPPAYASFTSLQNMENNFQQGGTSNRMYGYPLETMPRPIPQPRSSDHMPNDRGGMPRSSSGLTSTSMAYSSSPSGRNIPMSSSVGSRMGRPLPPVPTNSQGPPVVPPRPQTLSAPDFTGGIPGVQGGFVASPTTLSPPMGTSYLPQLHEEPPPPRAPSPSTTSSGSLSRTRTRQSVQSAHSSNSMISSLSPVRTPSSFETSEWPSWRMPIEEEGPVRDSTMRPNENHQTVPINADPGMVIANKHFDLVLHKGSASALPRYGKGECVEGYIELHSTEHVEEIEVILQGILLVSYWNRGQAHDQTKLTLLEEHKKLYNSAFNMAPGHSYSFQFFFPEKCNASDTPLPPSWNLVQPGFTAEVSYSVRAILRRRGFYRPDEKVNAKIEYHPRNYSPPISLSDESRPRRILEINNNLPPMGHTGAEKPMVPTSFKTRVPAALNVEVTLVRISEVTVKGQTHDITRIIATGANDTSQFQLGNSSNGRRGSGGTLTISGKCLAGMEGQEMSWGVGGVASIKYALRFVISPRADILDFAGFRERLPTFEHSEEIQLTTDPYPLAAQTNLSPSGPAFFARTGTQCHECLSGFVDGHQDAR